MRMPSILPFLPLLLWPVIQEAGADEGERDGQRLVLEPITTIAHRQPRSLSEVAGTVTVIDPERIERDMAIEIPDMIRYEPGVDVDGGGGRFPFGGFRIRGIGGNRTAVVVDNVPAADRFSVGSFADSGRGLMDLGLVSHMEILRGPASTLYGSKALGGVVTIATLDTEDLLAGRDRGTRIGFAGGTDADRLRMTAATAARHDEYALLFAGAGQRAGEVNVPDAPDHPPADRLTRRQGAILLRGARETAGARTRLTFDSIDESRETEVRAMLGTERFVNTTSMEGDDRREQWRVLLDQEFNDLGRVSRGHWRVWHQEAEIRQRTREERAIAPTPVDLFREFNFRHKTTGIGADLESDFDAFGFDHRFGYGFEVSRSDLVQRRDALQTNRETGDSTSVVLGEGFPLRDFPRTRLNELGVYVHDEIHLWPGGPMLSPGLRFEYYDLESRGDPLFDEAFPNAETTDLSHTAWMPKLGLVWPVTDDLDYFVQYASGFRAPPFEDVNIGLDIPMFNIRAIPNPDLKPEKGRSLETGIRWRGPETRVELTVFRNDYRDFIETRAALGPDPDTGTLLFQSVNRDRVRIEGIELRLHQDLPGPFNAEVGAEWLRGEDLNTGRALPEISPPKAILALEYAPAANWDMRLVTTAVRGQRSLTDAAGNPQFSPPGYTVADLIGRWRPRHDLRLSLGLFNLTDKTYWRASNVTGRPPDDPTLPYLAEPGRSVLGRLEWVF
jgi:hemoglobin/transferrin/lactoferrin receptor protein